MHEESINKIEKDSKKNVLLGSVLGYVGLGLTILYGLLFTPWIIRSIGDSQYGLFTLSGSIISIFAVDLGLGITANAFLAKYRASGDKEKEQRFLSTTYKLYLILDLVLLSIFLVFYFLIDSIYTGLTAAEKADLKVVFLISASFSIVAFPTTVFSGILQAYERFVFTKGVDVLTRLTYVITTIIALSSGLGLFALVTIQALTNLLGIIIKYVYIRFVLGIKSHLLSKFTKEDVSLIVRYSLWAGVVSICGRLVFSITPSILGIVSDSRNIAWFGIVVVLEGYIYTFGSVMNGLFLPKIARIFEHGGEHRKEQLFNLAVKVGRYQIFILGLAEIGFICCGKEFITVWMHGDSSYSPAFHGTVMVMLYQLLFVPSLVFHDAMYYEKKTIRHLAFATMAKAFVNLGLSFLLSYFFGMYGACIAIFVARSLELVLLNIYYKKDLQVSLLQFYKKTYARFLPTGAVALAIGLSLHFFIPGSTLTKLVIIAVAVTASYLLMYWFLLPHEEIDRFKLLFKQKAGGPLSKAGKHVLWVSCAAFFAVGGYVTIRVATDKNYGVAGDYVFVYDNKVIETFSIDLANNYTHVSYYNDGGTPYAVPKITSYKWKMSFQKLENDESYKKGEFIYYSEEQLQVCNDSWSSFYQYYHVGKLFYSRRNYSAYGGQKCFFKL